MLKRFIAIAGILASLLLPAYGAGTVPGFNLTQPLDELGRLMVGCRLFIIQAGTVSTPQTAYQDSALTIPLSNPILCDAFGRLPAWFVADGSIKLRLTKSTGVQVFTADGLLVVGASSGGGGGSPVDATTILATGDMKYRYGTGVLSGFVRANGRTIGSATSGATERANADTQALFVYLWDADANLTVSTGRGASAAADWAANKTIALPDQRGRVIAGADCMGNTCASRLTTTYFGANGDTLGLTGGTENHTLTALQAPVMTGTGTGSGVTTAVGAQNFALLSGTSGVTAGGSNINAVIDAGGNTLNVNVTTLSVTVNATGGAAHKIVQPTMIMTPYLKLRRRSDRPANDNRRTARRGRRQRRMAA